MGTGKFPFLSDRTYREMIDQAPEAILVLDKSWRVLEANQKARQLLGYSLEEFRKLNFFGLESGFSSRQAERYLGQANSSSTPIFTGKKLRKDGKLMSSETRLTFLSGDKADLILAFFRELVPDTSSLATLKKEKELLDTLMDHLPMSIYFKDRECRLTRVNKKLMQDLGVEQQETLLGKTDIELFGEAFGKMTMAIDREIIRTGKSVSGLIESRKLPDNTFNWTLTTKIPLIDPDGKIIGIAGVTTQINELKKAEEALRLREHQLSIASEIADLGYWEYDLIHDRFTFNDNFYRVYRTSVEEMGGYHMNAQRFSELFFFPEDAHLVRREIQTAIATQDPGFSRQLEHRIRYLNGETGYVCITYFIEKNKKGETIKIYGINQMVTKRKRIELAIKDSESTLQKAFEISAIGNFRYDIRKDQYEWSERALAVIGFPDQQPPQDFKSFLALIPAEDQEKLQREMRSDRMDIEHRIRTREGNKWFRFMAHRETDSKQTPLYAIGIVKDITQRKLVEIELSNYRDHLEKLVKERTLQLENINKDLEAFAYSISHDLRGPLRHINGFANILKRNLEDAPDNIQEYIDFITTASNRMGTMIDGLLHFSRLGQQELAATDVDLNKLIREVIRYHKPDTMHRQIIWEVGPLPTIQADPHLLKIVFENLISNAIKYTRTRQVAVIGIQSLPTSEHKCCISITDNGVGFNMKYVDKLFGVFQRLHHDEEFEGNGIGLAHAQQIINRHGGKIRAEAKPGEGATFYVSL